MNDFLQFRVRNAARSSADDQNFFNLVAFQTLMKNAFTDHARRASDYRFDWH
jgi:hypothetical protein